MFQSLPFGTGTRKCDRDDLLPVAVDARGLSPGRLESLVSPGDTPAVDTGELQWRGPGSGNESL